MISRFASPGDDYLRRIGELAYAVSSLEWTVLGDLYRLRACVPDSLTAGHLAGQTTGTIASRLLDASKRISEAEVAAFIRAGGEALSEAATLRNAVLHARPATIDDEQRLYRWRLGSKPEAFAISDEWLDNTLLTIAKLSHSVDAARLSFDDYPHPG
ncbi:hypothetical protein [Microbacterium sp. BH-3-3-3]|uniref:hypothetical protein n=1 Tax=Microbacterium sp. BH-3-3-3 TaxID=1906742 RepID=UPI0011A78D7E|nr:hypothetical protein [Microbacterium sp. BH-3-3-3]